MSTIICPTCGLQHPAAEGFCQCGYPLYLDDVASNDLTASHNPGRLPGESGPVPTPPPDPTVAMPQPQTNPSAGPMVMCPSGHPNEATRTLCSTCGMQLGAAAAPTPAPFAAPPGPRREVSGGVIAAAVVAGVIVIGVGIWAITRPSDDDSAADSDGDTVIDEANVERSVVAVDPSLVAAEASSVLGATSEITYALANTLDGDLATAWNNDSLNDGSGEGVTLTYTFASPVELASIELINGYTKTPETFRRNSRIAEIDVVTDSQTFRVGLHDSDTTQTIEQDFGLTGSVTLRVVAIYVGDGWDNPEFGTDLALSEISFFRFEG